MALFRERWCPRPTPTLIAQHREKTARQWNSNKKRDQSNNGLGNKRFQWGIGGRDGKKLQALHSGQLQSSMSHLFHHTPPPFFFRVLYYPDPKWNFPTVRKTVNIPDFHPTLEQIRGLCKCGNATYGKNAFKVFQGLKNDSSRIRKYSFPPKRKKSTAKLQSNFIAVLFKENKLIPSLLCLPLHVPNLKEVEERERIMKRRTKNIMVGTCAFPQKLICLTSLLKVLQYPIHFPRAKTAKCLLEKGDHLEGANAFIWNLNNRRSNGEYN
ncbi:hypothetical protein CEXT_177601 [Caerostris extrusa]|uniref:Uncharacterized protein n=1 Tax=Caerostris extrusa TaxID=172846 RepID=A0AAV4WKV4_CAEEX|nr:hypothetical protein CEXT_177601 [Caerostris extrusa]